MKVSGFSFIKNAIKFNYPVAESLRSILPLCDEIVVAVGDCTDETRSLVASISPRIRIIDTVWDETLKDGGKVLAVETDKAFKAISADSDWCVYIQGDEVMHEDGIPAVKEAMHKWKDKDHVDGLLFNYRHFFGSYEYTGNESGWYRHEIRVVKNNSNIYSYKDAQGFRKENDRKLNVKKVDAYIHHYGWVQDLESMMRKFIVKDKIYNGRDGDLENIIIPEDYIYKLVSSLKKYNGTHPAVMDERIKLSNIKFEYDTSRNRLKMKDRFKNMIEFITGTRPFDHNNYKIV